MGKKRGYSWICEVDAIIAQGDCYHGSGNLNIQYILYIEISFDNLMLKILTDLIEEMSRTFKEILMF